MSYIFLKNFITIFVNCLDFFTCYKKANDVIIYKIISEVNGLEIILDSLLKSCIELLINIELVLLPI